eukprot:1158148-Pelagomonas_calceolata.AAC.4
MHHSSDAITHTLKLRSLWLAPSGSRVQHRPAVTLEAAAVITGVHFSVCDITRSLTRVSLLEMAAINMG